MATPTDFSVQPVEGKALCRALEAITPSPRFASPDNLQSYDYMCRLEHDKLSRQEVDKFRQDISDPAYWKCEARCLKEQLAECIWRQLIHEHCNSGGGGWQDVVKAYRRRLNRQGVKTEQVRAMRLCITDQAYWKPESDLLREVCTQAEQAWVREGLRRKTAKLSSNPSRAQRRIKLTSIVDKQQPRKCLPKVEGDVARRRSLRNARAVKNQ